jgi:hypothetical protein
MTKQYFCKNVIDTIPCNESDPDNFVKGRYSICIKCRNSKNRQTMKDKKVKETKDEINEVDNGKNIQKIVDYSLKNKNFTDGTSLYETIQKINEENKVLVKKIEVFEKFEKNYEKIINAFNLMKLKIENLESELIEHKRKNDNTLLSERLKNLENFRRDFLDDKFKQQF